MMGDGDGVVHVHLDLRCSDEFADSMESGMDGSLDTLRESLTRSLGWEE